MNKCIQYEQLINAFIHLIGQTRMGLYTYKIVDSKTKLLFQLRNSI